MSLPSGSFGLARPTRQMLGDEVYESLKALIMNHVIAPGARMNIDALTRELGTSSTPVREALARLESDGLVTKFALRGYSTTPLLNRRSFEELYELRLLLEPWAARHAAEAVDESGAERLEAELATVVEAPDSTGFEIYQHFLAHDARLHDLIMELAGNETTRRTFGRLHAHLHLIRLNYGKEQGSHAVDEHRALVDAIIARDADGAEAAMRAHLSSARDRLRGAVPEE